jgi:c(7)-type cytochrome triheme protein
MGLMTATDNLRAFHCSLMMAVLVAFCGTAWAGQWQPLMEDGLHDTTNPALEVLQNPADALSRLPADTAGNKVDWVRAVRDGYITPRSQLRENKPVRILDSKILMNTKGSLPRVRFDHEPHARWLDCSNCHEQIFKSKAGETPVTMNAILEGEYCGVCHGAVSFPLTECNRCHTVPHDDASQGAQ